MQCSLHENLENITSGSENAQAEEPTDNTYYSDHEGNIFPHKNSTTPNFKFKVTGSVGTYCVCTNESSDVYALFQNNTFDGV